MSVIIKVDYLQTLDDILLHLKNHNEYKVVGDLHDEICPKLEFLIFVSAFDKLYKDGYIIDRAKNIPDAEYPLYILSFSGHVFIDNGGYVAQQKTEVNQKFLLSLEKWLIVAGTVFAGAYGVYELIHALFC